MRARDNETESAGEAPCPWRLSRDKREREKKMKNLPRPHFRRRKKNSSPLSPSWRKSSTISERVRATRIRLSRAALSFLTLFSPSAT